MNKSNFTKHYTEPKGKYNILSTVIFRIVDNYKPFDHYEKGLKFLVDNVPKLLPNYYVRIYYDDTIYVPNTKNELINKEISEIWAPYFDKIKTLPHVQLCHYKHKLNEGLFGTLARFYPLFDYADNANIENVIISDVDIENTGSLTKLFPEMIKFMDDNNTDVHYIASNCYTRMTRFDIFSEEEKNERSPAFIACCIISKTKFPKKLFKDFFTCMEDLSKKLELEGKSDGSDCDKTEIFIHNESKGKKLINKQSHFLYGIDEFFLYVAVSRYLKEMKIPYSCTLFNDTRSVLSNIYQKSEKFTEGNPDEYKELVKSILGKFYDEKIPLEKNYRRLVGNIFNDSINQSEITQGKLYYYKYVFDNINRIFKNMPLDKLPYHLEKSDVECVLAFPEFKPINKVLTNV